MRKQDQWEEANESGLAAILENLPPRYNHLIGKNFAICDDLWDHLEENLCKNDGPNRAATRSKFINCIEVFEHPPWSALGQLSQGF